MRSPAPNARGCSARATCARSLSDNGASNATRWSEPTNDASRNFADAASNRRRRAARTVHSTDACVARTRTAARSPHAKSAASPNVSPARSDTESPSRVASSSPSSTTKNASLLCRNAWPASSSTHVIESTCECPFVVDVAFTAGLVVVVSEADFRARGGTMSGSISSPRPWCSKTKCPPRTLRKNASVACPLAS